VGRQGSARPHGELRRMGFESGSMAPKFDAARCFVDRTWGIAEIGALGGAAALRCGEAGARVPSPD
jgi:carbamate kinase